MAKWELLIVVTFTALVSCTEVEDVEQKKRNAGKGTSINSIPTGAQKQDYTYSIYTQNPNSQSGSTSPSSYQSQVPNSFYPSQGSSQYYSSPSTQSEPSSSSYGSQQQQPQISLLPPPTTSQFVPLNFVPNPGYQSKYQIVPSKANGNIQVAFLQQPPSYSTQPIVPYAPQLFSPNPTTHISPHQNTYNQIPQGHYNVPSYQPLPLGGSYLGQPSTMLLFAQPNPSPYNNLLYQNPVQSFYNYYPTNSQSKYNVQYVPQGSTSEYEKLQGPVSQSVPKEDNDVVHGSEYTGPPSESSSSYKSAYSASRNTYAKL
ncbi:hypothetical protein PYW08_011700 [Mythimna loreyi]|uniref:Uncharacterized protein n=1 Tax=Mythimna loreyi TaxID=667449 RepID=A0ACC2QMR4_9NEOP|nr:hypothetical protein PYW08_011700 [Mythimna loreyi]